MNIIKYDLVNETCYYNELMWKYFNHYVNNSCISVSYIDESSYDEICRFSLHQLSCGEIVYIIGYPITENKSFNYKNMYFIDSWDAFNSTCCHRDILILDLSVDGIRITDKNINSFNIIKIMSFNNG